MPYLEAALETLDPEAAPTSSRCATASMGRYHHYQDRASQGDRFFQRARELAEPLDDAATLAQVYSFLAGGHQHLLLYDDSDRWARVSMAMGERKKYPGAVALGYEFLSENDTARGAWDRALALRCAKSGRRRQGGLADPRRVERVSDGAEPARQRRAGRGAKAVEEALELSERIGEERLATWLDPMAAIIAADQGDDDAARLHADRALDARPHARSTRADRLGAERARALQHCAAATSTARSIGMNGSFALVRDTENRVCRHLVMAGAAEAYLRAGRHRRSIAPGCAGGRAWRVGEVPLTFGRWAGGSRPNFCARQHDTMKAVAYSTKWSPPSWPKAAHWSSPGRGFAAARCCSRAARSGRGGGQRRDRARRRGLRESRRAHDRALVERVQVARSPRARRGDACEVKPP
jgi:hypothetical protein